MMPEKLSRRERDRLRQRQEILAAALELFAQRGYHRISMQEIAEKAEFAIGTLYKFFRNKEELYKALVLEQCDHFEAELLQALTGAGDEIAKLRAYVQVKVAWCQRNLPFVRLFLAESRGASFNLKASLEDDLRQRYYAFMENLAQVFAQGFSSGRLRRIAPPYFLAVALDSVIDASLLLWLDAPERHPYPDDPDAILGLFFHGLLASQDRAGAGGQQLPGERVYEK